MVQAVICDWNGTLVTYQDERPILEWVARDIFKTCAPLHPVKAARILRVRRELEDVWENGTRDGDLDFVREMFRLFNSRIIKGTPARFILDSIDRFCAGLDMDAKLEHRVLRPVREFQSTGKVAGILSAGFRCGIERVLKFSEYRGCFDFCAANDLITKRGKAVEFGLDIYQRKPEFLSRILREKGLDARRVAYIGDSGDDEGCFEAVGFPVVTFLAADLLKEKCARLYGAFVPETEDDLKKYLMQT